MRRPVKIAVIGKNNHARRLIDIIRSLPRVVLSAVYYPFEAPPCDLPITDDVSRLKDCDAIVIASPTPTHGDYLRRLSDFPGYVLVEKPATMSLEEVEEFKSWGNERKARTRVNFNLLHSTLYENLEKTCKDQRMGRLISFDVHTSHGLAFTSKYRGSWREQSGVLETMGVHFVNLAMKLFGKVEDVYPRFSWIATRAVAPDTASLSLMMSSGVQVNLRHSYAAPALIHWLMTASNGYWLYDGRSARLFSPRDTFDSSGRFVSPPAVATRRIPHDVMWHESLKNALSDFVEAVRTNRRFDPSAFDLAIDSVEPIHRALALLPSQPIHQLT